MAVKVKIRDGKLQYKISWEAAKILPISSGKIVKYEYLIAELLLSCHQSRMIEQAKFTYSPLRKTLEKRTKIVEDQKRKQVKALKLLKSYVQQLSFKGVLPEN